jgi:hypothetical protein
MTREASSGTIPAMSKTVGIEQLERRSLLSAPPVSAANGADVTPPTLVKEQLIGSDPRNVTGVVLTFSEALDPASTVDRRTYRVGKRTDQQQNYDIEVEENNKGLVRFEEPIYDAANFTVTLIAQDPFNITRRFRTIRVLGREVVTIRDLAGNRIDGDGNGRAGGDAVEHFTFKRAKSVAYEELDRDRVRLQLEGPGRLWVLRKTRDGKVVGRGDGLRVYIEDADPASSILTGKVGGQGNGVAIIDELVNTSTAQVPIANDPAFQIVRSIA